MSGAGDRLTDQGEQLEDLSVDLFEGDFHVDHRTCPGGVDFPDPGVPFG